MSPPSHPSYLIDTSAVIALLFKEPGHEKVRVLLDSERCFITAANYQEVVFRLVRVGADPVQVVADLNALEMEVVPFSPEFAADSTFSGIGFEMGLSLGDRCCLITALQSGMVAVTADQKWKDISIPGVKVMVIR